MKSSDNTEKGYLLRREIRTGISQPRDFEDFMYLSDEEIVCKAGINGENRNDLDGSKNGSCRMYFLAVHFLKKSDHDSLSQFEIDAHCCGLLCRAGDDYR